MKFKPDAEHLVFACGDVQPVAAGVKQGEPLAAILDAQMSGAFRFPVEYPVLHLEAKRMPLLMQPDVDEARFHG